MVAEFDRYSPRKSSRRGISRPYNAPVGGRGSVKSLARALTRERVLASAPFHPLSPEQARRLRLCQLRLGQAWRTPSLRVLRKRRQGDHVGDYLAAGESFIFRRTHPA
jgi:hypothetical protein